MLLWPAEGGGVLVLNAAVWLNTHATMFVYRLIHCGLLNRSSTSYTQSWATQTVLQSAETIPVECVVYWLGLANLPLPSSTLSSFPLPAKCTQTHKCCCLSMWCLFVFVPSSLFFFFLHDICPIWYGTIFIIWSILTRTGRFSQRAFNKSTELFLFFFYLCNVYPGFVNIGVIDCYLLTKRIVYLTQFNNEFVTIFFLWNYGYEIIANFTEGSTSSTAIWWPNWQAHQEPVFMAKIWIHL